MPVDIYKNRNVRDVDLKAKKGDYQGAITELNQVRPPTCESLHYQGCTHLELEELAEALIDFDQAMKSNQHVEYYRLHYKRAFDRHLVGPYSEGRF
jgi:tryptophan 2,3-dioxygenase